MEVGSLNHWMTREVPGCNDFKATGSLSSLQQRLHDIRGIVIPKTPGDFVITLSFLWMWVHQNINVNVLKGIWGTNSFHKRAKFFFFILKKPLYFI